MGGGGGVGVEALMGFNEPSSIGRGILTASVF